MGHRIALLVLLVPALALAEVPAKLGYQGRLLDADGTPSNGPTTFRFTLYDAATGGTALWSEEQTLGLSDGFYATYLGDATQGGLPADVFDGSERFLETALVGADGQLEVLSPRQRVDSVAYALRASDAGRLDGKPASAYQAQITGTCGAGTFVDGINADGSVTCGADSGGTVTSVTASAPLASSGGAAPILSMPEAGGASDGWLSAADWTRFDAKLSTVTAGPGLTVAGTPSEPVLAVTFGSGAGTVTEGDDPRLTDARAPTAGSNDYIQNTTGAAQGASFNVSGSGTIGGTAIVSGSLGVGMSPGVKLDVNGPIRASGSGGNVPHGCAIRIATFCGASGSASCAGDERPVGGGGACGSGSLRESRPGASEWNVTCTTADCTNEARAVCCQY